MEIIDEAVADITSIRDNPGIVIGPHSAEGLAIYPRVEVEDFVLAIHAKSWAASSGAS